MSLEDYCKLDTDDLLKELAEKPEAIYRDRYVYIDAGSPILTVAHADVHPDIENIVYFDSHEETVDGVKDTRVYSPYLDDRLGVYAIFEKLSDFGINADILITTDEEVHKSSALEFSTNCPKNYNWIVEFDRKGEDVVLYSYKNGQMENELMEAGFKIGRGTSSDISQMTSLGLACFNVGIGYHDAHTPECWASLSELERQLERFQRFYSKNIARKYINEANY
jgi:hypothetical protein